MPKMKTNKSAKKRFNVTGSGKVKYKHANKSHILTKKTSKRKRQLRNNDTLAKGDSKRVKRMIIREG
jgi:large subunit ribosomal protein L35